MGLLSLLLAVPATGGVVVALVARLRSGVKPVALSFSVMTLAVAVVVWLRVDPLSGDFELVELVPWVPSLGVSYLLGIDAVSMYLILMTAVLTPIVVLASWNRVPRGEAALFSMVLWLEATLIGVFSSIDAVLFYVFWSLALAVLLLLVGLWGGTGRRRASLRFGVLTVGGGLSMLFVILACHFIHFVQSGSASFDVRHWEGLVLTPTAEAWLFWGLLLAFAIQTPLFPFHFWLTRTRRESPLVAQVFMSAIILKVGTYGIFRFLVPLFPRAAWTYAPTVMTLAVVSVLVGAVTAVLSSDPSKLATRVTVAHMGLVVMGLFSFAPSSVTGAFIIAITHGFFMSGLIIMAEKGRNGTGNLLPTALIEHRRLRFASVILILLAAGAVGVPSYYGYTIIRGAMDRTPAQAVGVAVGLVLLAVAFVRQVRATVQRSRNRGRQDSRGREFLLLLPLVMLVIWVGIAPGDVGRSLDSAARQFVARVSNGVVLTE